jgi:hypothetical protein
MSLLKSLFKPITEVLDTVTGKKARKKAEKAMNAYEAAMAAADAQRQADEAGAKKAKVDTAEASRTRYALAAEQNEEEENKKKKSLLGSYVK